MKSLTINEKIAQLRMLMNEHGIAAYVIPGSDEHQNEYLPALWKRREWISGFTGSAGTVIITANKAGLWTDSRYFLQAEEQLKGSEFTLFKQGAPDVPDTWEWLKYALTPGTCVGIDPRLVTYYNAKRARRLFRHRGLQFKFIEDNLVDRIWKDQPGLPLQLCVPHPIRYSGETTASKLARVRQEIQKENCNAIVFSKLDSIAWLFNIRGNDIPYNPLVIAYAIITDTTAELFISDEKITSECRQQLAEDAILFDYTQFKTRLITYKEKKFWIDEKNTSIWVVDLLNRKRLFFGECPVMHFKAVKNDVEIANFCKAHLRDGAAMVKFLHWLDTNVASGTVTEASAALQLENFRAQNELFKEASFPTISAYNAHGAIVHYSHTAETNVTLKAPGLYLLDSGAHYLDGTTDITRTIAFGMPSSEQRECFTRVLQGHIELALARFPEGTLGIQLDTIARKPLWDIGLDYGHGTGHGIGSYLCVHEGPHSISQSRGVLVKLKAGMICTNEPGYYKTGEYGIRIENVIYVCADEQEKDNTFFQFKTISLCPIDLKLIKKELLTERQITFFNSYHRTVLEKLSPYLNNEEIEWLEAATRPI